MISRIYSVRALFHDLQVTGVSGFLGSHVIHQLLEAGYLVRGTVRTDKVALVQEGYASYGDQLEVIAIDDLINGDFTDALKGRASPEAALNAAIEGSLNILRQAEKAGIARFVLVSSMVAVRKPGDTSETGWTDKDWNSVTREEVLDGMRDEMFIYAAEKTLAERAVWEFADQHPHMDITTEETAVNPPFFYGPFAPGFRAPDATISALSTNSRIYALLRPDEPIPPFLLHRWRKRILMSGEWFSFKDAVEYIAEVRPELRDRLAVDARSAPATPQTSIDNTRAREVLGLKEMVPWRDTVLAAVDDLIKLEKEWASKGLTVQ
ncbi:hypothetical protein A0H81_09122 [Grifola frondosa]|uniref:NAD-dependent epimerase/dehydratase domain-containing protein n=1 Tax=Grifola frondosa TaxID=5627 RepID=A0A1C7M2B3_GRIFR|nr:hypothetical protein A0H81_09122 [Grifola frondosa]